MAVGECQEGGENTTILVMLLFKLTSNFYENSKYGNTETGNLKTVFSVFCIESDMACFVSI